MYRLLSLLALAAFAAAPALAQRAPADASSAGAQVAFAALSDGLAFVENRGQ